MPDIFVQGQDDLARENTATDPIAESSDQPLPQTASSSFETLSNAQKHAMRAKDKHNLPGHTHNILASFFYYPDRVNFLNKDPEETVILLVRRHPITNIPWMIMAFIMIMVPAFISVFPFFEGISGNLQMVLPIIWYMITAAFILEKFLTWFFNVNIVTDERIIDVDFVNLIYRDITEADIEQIQDVTVRVGGAIRTLFNYGDVAIQTAAEVPELMFEAVPHPDQVSRILRELRVEEQQEKIEGRVR